MEVEEHGSFYKEGGRERAKEKKAEGCFSFLIAVFSPLCSGMTAEDVIISFLSPMHKHQSRNASESRKKKKKKEVSKGTLSIINLLTR